MIRQSSLLVPAALAALIGLSSASAQQPPAQNQGPAPGSGMMGQQMNPGMMGHGMAPGSMQGGMMPMMGMMEACQNMMQAMVGPPGGPNQQWRGEPRQDQRERATP